MKLYNMFACIALLAGAIIQPAQAQNFQKSEVVTTAIPSLLIPADIRSAGMGETGLATTPDANSIYLNMAKLPFAKDKAGAGLNYTPWMSDVSSGRYLLGASGYHKLAGDQVISSSFRYFKMGTYQVHSVNGVWLGSMNPYELLFDIGYSRKLSDKFGLGLTLRYIHSNLSVTNTTNNTYKAGNGLAADISVFYNNTEDNGEGFSAGLALANLGSKISYHESNGIKDFIPAKLGIGVAYTKVLDDRSNLQFAADVNKLLVPANDTDPLEYSKRGLVSSWIKGFGSKAMRYSIGTEYKYDDFLILRAGYVMEAVSQGGRKGFTAGVGLKYKSVTANFAYMGAGGDVVSRSPLANSLKFGILFGIK